MSVWRIFLLLLGIVGRLASAVDLLTLCRGRLTGMLLPNPYDCGSYYVCQSGPQLAYCGEGLHFDRVHKVCNWPEKANCRLSKVEKEPPSHSAQTLKEDSTQDNEVKLSNPDSDFTEDELNKKLVEHSKPNSIEVELQGAIEEVSILDKELVDTMNPEEEQASNAKPIQLPLAKLPSLDLPDNNKVDSHGPASMIPSLLPQDPSPGESAEKEVAVEKDELLEQSGSSKSAHNATHVIQVHVPVHHSEAVNSIVGGDAEAVAPPKPSRNVTHVIEKHVPVHPIEVGDFIANAHNSSAQSEKIVEKVGSAEEFSHEIELQAPPYTANISNAIGDTINEIPKDDSTQSSGSPGPVHGLPANISNAFVSAVVERVDSGKPTTGSGQVIELQAQSIPPFVLNVIANALNAFSPVERVESAEPSESSGQPNPMPLKEATSESRESLKESSKSESSKGAATDVDSSEDEPTLYLSSEEDHQAIPEAGQSSEEKTAEGNFGSQSAESQETDSSAQQNLEKADSRPAERPSMHKPKPHSPAISQIDVNSSHHQWNLTEVILSVAANTSTNGTIIRPIVGAHDIKTGDPIVVMVEYNPKNVQCIHNGLYFLPHPSNCQKYFICAYRHLHLHSCGDNLIWSYRRERCELEINSRCYSNETLIASPTTTNTHNGTTAVTNLVRTSTPMPPLRTTISSTLAKTPKILDEELPNCPSIRQVYLPSYDDCNKYYICILGHAVLTSCPDKLHWDAIGEFCGTSTKVRCASRVQKVST